MLICSDYTVDFGHVKRMPILGRMWWWSLRSLPEDRLYCGKGILHLLNSLVHLTRIGFKESELEVFGRGPLEHKVRELVSTLNLAHNVRMRVFVKREELVASMAASDIECFPSQYEVSPVTLIEVCREVKACHDTPMLPSDAGPFQVPSEPYIS